VGRSQRRRRKHWSFYGDLLGRDNRALFDGSTERWLEVCNTPVVFGPEDLPKLRKAGHSPKEAVFPFRPNMMTVRIGAWVVDNGHLCWKSRQVQTPTLCN
jgi:hypothetical protein